MIFGSKTLGLTAIAAALLWMQVVPALAQGKANPASGPETVESILDHIVQQLWVQTDRHWHEGEYNHVVNLHRVEVAVRPNLLEAYSNAGYLLWSMDRDAEAVALYEQGIKENPDTYSMFDELGFYYFNRKRDYPKAISYYERAVNMKDCEHFTLHMLAHSYERTNQAAKALTIWERAAAMPNNPSAEVAKRNIARLRKSVSNER